MLFVLEGHDVKEEKVMMGFPGNGMMGSYFWGFGLLGWLINLLVIGAVVYIAVKLALRNKKD